MREISSSKITEAVKRLFLKANVYLTDDIKSCIIDCEKKEYSSVGKNILNNLVLNYKSAESKNIPICQDTGMAVIFAEIGQEVHISGELFEDAVNEGVRQAYDVGYFRKSVVKDPLERKNSGDNTPAIIYTRIVGGDKISLSVMPKGFGSENMSRIKMLNPSEGEDAIVDFVKETVCIAGGKPCPPLIIGVGIGGTFDYAAVLSKKALLNEVGKNSIRFGELEQKILKAVNETGIGPQGLGGDVTALWVSVEGYATHIAGLPVAVNIGCHVTRHAKEII